jgi:hypothetical protein
MTFREMAEHHNTRPFIPYRIVMADGRTYEIPHPEFAFVGVTATTVGIPRMYEGVQVFDTVRVANEHVTSLVPLTVTNPNY